ncbi:hypothetical protein UNDYM_2286 [Undibacterium sp. YM2]|uniref:GIY-YIG nuclease family protein n=1 Tax=Undibacterium sp. YM2 TaxID=2058625 RepID=UPI001331F808|nr:GIY-YIG nuclease family protein [Undibacterium sp. YM2]BBB66539.1 hypothetical protein UNDYM_2286 [Undibacterium sp. YM2]
MPIYFLKDTVRKKIKIGRSKNVQQRIRDLQTGNPSPLQLMGWMNVNDEVKVERRLHQTYQDWCELGEWFNIDSCEVLTELKRENGFVGTPKNSYEIVGYDNDAIPEYLGVCEWQDFEIYECCPYCACLCGMHEQGDTGMYHCINCGEFRHIESLSE